MAHKVYHPVIIPLAQAILLIERAYISTGRRYFLLYQVKPVWGNPKPSALINLATILEQYNLVYLDGKAAKCTVEITRTGYELITETDPRQRAMLFKKLILYPPTFRELWEQWGAEPPSFEESMQFLTKNQQLNQEDAIATRYAYQKNLQDAGLAQDPAWKENSKRLKRQESSNLPIAPEQTVLFLDLFAQDTNPPQAPMAHKAYHPVSTPLEPGIQCLKRIYDSAGKQPRPLQEVNRIWGHLKQPDLNRRVTDLKEYGLILLAGKASKCTVKMTRVGCDILEADSGRRAMLFKGLALTPSPFRELWEQRGAELPYAEGMQFLTRDLQFKKQDAMATLYAYQKNLQDAGLAQDPARKKDNELHKPREVSNLSTARASSPIRRPTRRPIRRGYKPAAGPHGT